MIAMNYRLHDALTGELLATFLTIEAAEDTYWKYDVAEVRTPWGEVVSRYSIYMGTYRHPGWVGEK